MSRNRQVTIVDIAGAAGVSIATVSNVLNRRNVPMSEETIQKVEKAAEELGYRRNVMAASLSRRKSYELGLLVPSFGGYYGRFAEEMQRAAHEFGYHLSVFSAGGFNPEIEKRHLDTLLQRRVDGLFCHGLAMSQEATRTLVGDGTPLVLFNGWNWPEDLAVAAVNLDFAGGCVQAAAHLYEQGCRSLLYLARPGAHEIDRQRRLGLAEGLKAYPDMQYQLVELIAPDVEAQLLQVMEAFEAAGPVGVVGFDDSIALSFMSLLIRQGRRVPQDWMVVGINNEPVARQCYPTLTSVDIPYHLQAGLALRRMLLHLGETGKLEKSPMLESEVVAVDEGREVRIPLKLVPRMSTGFGLE
jgi:LacI family transcriptional regulator